MKAVAKVLQWVGGTLLFLVVSGWAVLMLHYSNLPGRWLPDIAAVAYALFAICMAVVIVRSPKIPMARDRNTRGGMGRTDRLVSFDCAFGYTRLAGGLVAAAARECARRPNDHRERAQFRCIGRGRISMSAGRRAATICRGSTGMTS